MTVKRIVTNIETDNPAIASAFYTDILGLQLVMDYGWVLTFASKGEATEGTSTAPLNAGPTNTAPINTAQITIASEGGSGTVTPDLSIEVDNLDEIYQRAVAKNLPIEYGPITEPWGVRRFYIRDPFGKLLNILTHCDEPATQEK